MSYDGNVIAVHSTFNYTKVWFLNLVTNQATTVELNDISNTVGFDGDGSFYVGLAQKYLKIDPPYTSATTFFLDKTITIIPCQDGTNSVAELTDPNTGEGGLFQFNLKTAQVGADVGITTAYQIDTQSKHVFGALPSAGYGARQWNYATGGAETQIGPVRGAGEGSSKLVGFTSDGNLYAMKIGPNNMGRGQLGGGPATIPMDAILPLSGDNSTMIFEGLLDDTTALLSHAASPRSLLVAFDLTNGQVKWSNNNGNNQADPTFAQESARAGVQPILGPSGPPPQPVGFWKENVLAYETV
jgi:outer membrane protein assembly factor BamB